MPEPIPSPARQWAMPLSRGSLLVQLPAHLDAHDHDEVEEFLGMILRRLEREAGRKPAPPPKP
jgi:hypothetical protein